ncbi:hypothetical protein IQ238_03080 [Pleurocapsales cyanobacterium LEGE 06147]|nr:hypothetical protein [Pleurocapsales cyanobacterium LEGE 06147]
MKCLISMFYKSILVTVLVSLIGWLSFSFVIEPASAASSNKNRIEPSLNLENQSIENREKAYEEEVNIGDKPEDLEKQYEKNLQEYHKQNPDEGGLVDQAKGLLEKATGNN